MRAEALCNQHSLPTKAGVLTTLLLLLVSELEEVMVKEETLGWLPP